MSRNEEYLRRARLVDRAIRVKQSASHALKRLEQQTSPPQWLVASLRGILENADPLPADLKQWRDSAQETPADLVGALQDKVHTDAGPFRAGQSVKETEVCPHGIRAPHECKECADSLVIPDGWCPICGGKDGEHKSGCQDGSEHF
jgi:hypothetical protein